MINVKMKIPNLDIGTPESPAFWRKVGIELVKDIRKRTLAGKDADNVRFKPYAKITLKDRSARGRSTSVNLTDTGKMLGAMTHGIRPTKHGVSLQLSGEQGAKAWYIEKGDREFFSLNEKQVEKVIKSIKQYIAKKNS